MTEFNKPTIAGHYMLYDFNTNTFYLYLNGKYYYTEKTTIRCIDIPYFNSIPHYITLNTYNYIPSCVIIDNLPSRLYSYYNNMLILKQGANYLDYNRNIVKIPEKKFTKYNFSKIIYLIFNTNIKIFNKKNIRYTENGPIIKKKESYFWFTFTGTEIACAGDWLNAIKPKYISKHYINKEYITYINFPVDNKIEFKRNRNNLYNYTYNNTFEETPNIYYAPPKYIFIYDILNKNLNKYIISKIFRYL